MRNVLLCVFLLLVTIPIWGQADTGVITGTVTDQAGSVIPAAKVTITSQSTGVSSELTSNGEGYFTSAPMKADTYSVTATAPGFQSETESGIILQVQARLKLNFKMNVGQVSQSVVVTNQTPVIDTETSSLGTVVSSSTITAMPLNGRSYLQLAGLGTGVVQTTMGQNSQTNGNTGGSTFRYDQVTFASNGARGTLNNFLLDGIDNNSNDNGGSVVLSNVDAIQEFKIQTSSYSAEFGRSGGAVINAVTKSGTNSYHGDAFEFLRNSVFDARNFFQTTGPKAPYRQNIYGGTIGGPIKKDKLFWFGDYQGTSINQPVTLTSTVPTPLERMGNFSEELQQNGTVIYQPNSYNPATNSRTPYNGNIITSGIDPLAQAFVDLYPLPNVPGGALTNNYTITPSQPLHLYQGDFRGDWDPSPNNQGFFRFSDSSSTDVRAARFPAPAIGQRGGTFLQNIMGASLGQTHIFSPTIVNEFRVGFNWYYVDNGFPPAAPPANLLVPGVTLIPEAEALTEFSPTGYTGLGSPGYEPTILTTEERQITDAVNMVRGKHSIVVGGEVRWSEFNIFQLPNPNGIFNFSGEFTQNPAIAAAGGNAGGDGLADTLLGLPTQSSIDTAAEDQNRQYTLSGFGEDNWKVTPTLTLNLGVRYDYFNPIVEKHNNQANFNLATGQLDVADQNGNSRTLTVPDKLNFSPRIGVAKTFNKNTVISAGGGIFWSGQEIRTAAPFQLAYNLPFYYQPSFVSDGITPVLTVSGGFPPLNPSQEPDPGVTGEDARLKTPNYVQYNISIQQALPGKMSLELSYAGSKGTHLQSMLDYNQDPTPGPGSVQARRPYPNYGPMAFISNRGNSKYYSGQAKLEEQASKGLYFLSSFTWSKAYDDQPEICCDSPWPQNSYNIPSEEGLADFNQSLRWVLSYDYLLPIGTGQKLLGGVNRVTNEIVGGWHFGGIYQLGSGFPFSPTMGYDPSNTGSQGLIRAEQILPNGNLPRSQRSVNQWFNTAAYTDAAQYTFGDAGRNTLIGPDLDDWDMSLVKTFPVREAQNVEFRFELFNSLNHPNFAQPDPSVDDGPGAYGVVTATGLDNREIQFALKYHF